MHEIHFHPLTSVSSPYLPSSSPNFSLPYPTKRRRWEENEEEAAAAGGERGCGGGRQDQRAELDGGEAKVAVAAAAVVRPRS